MHSDHQEVPHHANKNTALKLEGVLGKVIAVVAVLMIGAFIWALSTGSGTPSWMQ